MKSKKRKVVPVPILHVWVLSWGSVCCAHWVTKWFFQEARGWLELGLLFSWHLPFLSIFRALYGLEYVEEGQTDGD